MEPEPVHDFEHFDPELLAIFDGEEEFLKLPVFKKLDNSKLTCSLSNYIDFIPYDEVSDRIMRGTDKWDRTFIIFKLKFCTPTRTHFLTEVLFQKYSGDDYWVAASDQPARSGILATNGTINYVKIVQLLLHGRFGNTFNAYSLYGLCDTSNPYDPTIRVTGDFVLG